MRIPRHLTMPVLIAAALLGGGAGCTNSTPHPSSTQRPGAAVSPSPTPTATPSSYPIEQLASTFTEVCVAFTVTPAPGSRLRAGGYDSVFLSKQETDAVGKIMVLFGIGWANDNHDFQVTYQGRKLKTVELAQMRRILAQAAGVAPAAVRLLPYPTGA